MKKMLFLLLFVIPTLAVMAQNEKKEAYLTKQLSEYNIKDVEVKTSGGYIDVTAVPASEARLEVYIKGNNGKQLTSEEIKKILEEKYELTIITGNNKLSAIAKRTRNDKDWKRALNISFAVFVPQNVTTDLATSGGRITIKGVSGRQNFATSGGGLTVENVSGSINGRTSGGSIDVSGSTDDIDLATSGGSINAKDCKGKIRLTTSGGSINLKDLEGEIKAMTSGGSIHGKKIAGEFDTHTSGGNIKLDDLSCTLDASTSGGNLDISMSGLGKHIKLRNSGGNIALKIPSGKGLDLDLSANRVKVDELTNFSGKVRENQVEGKMNGGGTSISAASGSGRVSLAFK